jgi:single-strand DNA-binding protein
MAYRGVNLVIMMGRLGKDVELKKTANGKSYCRFSIAVNNNNDSADWFTWTAWNAQAEFLAQYAKKGFGLYLQGYARMEQWDEDGITKRLQTQTVERVEIVSRTQNASQNGSNELTEAFPEEEEEVLPF